MVDKNYVQKGETETTYLFSRARIIYIVYSFCNVYFIYHII